MRKIVLDSFCKLPQKYTQANEIEVLDIPFYINDEKLTFDAYSKKDYLDVNESHFVIEEDYVKEEDVQEFFEQNLFGENEVLYLCTVDSKSVNYLAIKQVVEALKVKYPQTFEVIFLQSTNPAVKFLIQDAFEQKNSKDRLFVVKRNLEKKMQKYSAFILLDDKNIIAKYNERPTMALAFGVKPIYNLNLNGNFELFCREDGLTNGINKIYSIIEDLKKNNASIDIVITYAKSAKHAELLERLFVKNLNEKVKIDKFFMDPMLINEFGLGAIIVSAQAVI